MDGSPQDRRSTDRADRAVRTENDAVRADVAAPISWPLVERRRMIDALAGDQERRRSSDVLQDPVTSSVGLAPLGPFRVAALVGSIVRSADELSKDNWSLLIWISVAALYTAFAIWRPVPDVEVDEGTARARAIAEMVIVTIVVICSGGWASPIALVLVPSAMLASFVGGLTFSTVVVGGAAIVVTVAHLASEGLRRGWVDTALWIVLLALVTVTSALSHRRAMASADQQQAAIARVGRLAEANALLFSLQRVAQTLPASLDLNDVLDSTVARVQSLIDHSMLTVLLHSDVAGRFEPAKTTGYAGRGPVHETDLPRVLDEALRAPNTVRRDHMIGLSDGVGPGVRSGIYAALRARGAVVGLIAIESLQPNHFGQQQAEILHGLAEPFGIAIDNARLFRRLRIVSADEERSRIARDLHDHIGSSLAYLGFEIDRSIGAADRGEQVAASLKELRAQVTTMVGEVRETLYDLRSDVSENQDLPTTLKQFVDRVRGRSGLEISFVSDQRVRLSISHERELWHIAREALINVERHAQATKASMEWISTASHASLTIRDNGVGMLADAARIDSYGMRGMRERAATIDAKMTIETSPTGTVIRVGLHQPQGTPSWD